jgi:hypothetical protein
VPTPAPSRSSSGTSAAAPTLQALKESVLEVLRGQYIEVERQSSGSHTGMVKLMLQASVGLPPPPAPVSQEEPTLGQGGARTLSKRATSLLTKEMAKHPSTHSITSKDGASKDGVSVRSGRSPWGLAHLLAGQDAQGTLAHQGGWPQGVRGDSAADVASARLRQPSLGGRGGPRGSNGLRCGAVTAMAATDHGIRRGRAGATNIIPAPTPHAQPGGGAQDGPADGLPIDRPGASHHRYAQKRRRPAKL